MLWSCPWWAILGSFVVGLMAGTNVSFLLLCLLVTGRDADRTNGD